VEVVANRQTACCFSLLLGARSDMSISHSTSTPSMFEVILQQHAL